MSNIENKILSLYFRNELNENIVESYHGYITNTLKWEDYGQAEPTSRLLPNGDHYEEWEDRCAFDPHPFNNIIFHVYWLFDKEKINGKELEDYPWNDADYYGFDGHEFQDLRKLFEYMIKYI